MKFKIIAGIIVVAILITLAIVFPGLVSSTPSSGAEDVPVEVNQ